MVALGDDQLQCNFTTIRRMPWDCVYVKNITKMWIKIEICSTCQKCIEMKSSAKQCTHSVYWSVRLPEVV